MTMSERLRTARLAAGFQSAAQAARHYGWNLAAYRHHENGTSGFKSSRAVEYSEAFGVPVVWLLSGKGETDLLETKMSVSNADTPGLVQTIPILGDVAAGFWREPGQLGSDDDLPSLQIAIDGYAGVNLYALQVVGPSMNLIYPEGRWVIVAPIDDVGLREQDIVVVRRSRSGLFETTLKQVELESEMLVLWPRSNHKDFQDPVYMKAQEYDQDAPEIIGVVVADYARRDRPPKVIEL